MTKSCQKQTTNPCQCGTETSMTLLCLPWYRNTLLNRSTFKREHVHFSGGQRTLSPSVKGNILLARVSQPQYYWYFDIVVRAALHIAGCLAAPLTSTHSLEAAPTNQKCLQTLPDVLWGTKASPVVLAQYTKKKIEDYPKRYQLFQTHE